jgi:hypothetical protein
METELKEVSVVDQVAELATITGTTFEFEVQELTKLNESAKAITSTEDEAYKDVKAKMVERRNYIKNYCLDARREIKKVASSVSEVEDALYQLFVPEENRLIEIANKEKEERLEKERAVLLPDRKARLDAIGAEYLDEQITSMDATVFESFYQQCVADKNEAVRLENERVAKENEDKAKQLEWESKAQERADQAREEAEEKAEEAREIEEKQRKEEEARKLKERTQNRQNHLVDKLGLTETGTSLVLDGFIEVPKAELVDMDGDVWSSLAHRISTEINSRANAEQERIAKEKLDADERFNNWLNSHGVTDPHNSPDYLLQDYGTKIVLYKEVSVYEK